MAATEPAADVILLSNRFERRRAGLVAESTTILRGLFALAERKAPTPPFVLLQGETGARLESRRLGVAKPSDDWLTGKSWREIETEMARWAGDRSGGVRRAALALQRPPSTLANRVHRLGIEATRRPIGRNRSVGGER